MKVRLNTMSYYDSQCYGMVSTNFVGKSKLDFFGKNLNRNFFAVWGVVSAGIDYFGRMHSLTEDQMPINYPLDFYVFEYKEKIRIYFSNERSKRGFSDVFFDSLDTKFIKEKKLISRAKRMSGILFNDYVELDKKIVIKFTNLLDSQFKNIKIKNSDQLINANRYLYDQLFKSQEDTVKRIIREEQGKMNINPIFKARNLSVNNELAFGILQFDESHLTFFDKFLKPTVENEFGINVVRSGNIFDANTPDIMENIWTYIVTSRFILCDLGGKNSNVFYELGIANTVGKPVVTICDKDSYKNDYNEKLPFDISSNNTLFYENTAAGAEEFKQELISTIRSIITGRPVIRK